MLHVHRSERADGLVEALSTLLAAPPPDPLAPDVVAAPTRGIERWLSQRLSLRLGICANVEFPPPRRLVGDVVAAASGIEPEADPWLPERAVWPLLEVMDAALDEPWAATLAWHVRGHPARRLATARHVARLLARYELHRPELIAAWAAGEDEGWQAELWRRLRARIAVPSPAERLSSACAALEDDAALAGLPPRVSLFGLTRLPAGDLTILRTLATARDVHLFLLHPSPALWDKLRGAPPVARRREDSTDAVPANRLLASWGRDAREMQLVLQGDEHRDHHHAVQDAGTTLLARLQADVRADRASAPQAVDAADGSIRIHACHGRARQVEVLRDQILHLLSEDPSLEPRDVIVLCPDIEAFAPLIQATFGVGDVSAGEDDASVPADTRGAPDLRVRLADRALRQTNPVLGVVARLLDLASERLTASQVLDLCDREPVRRRFGFDDDAVQRIEQWVADSGIRWGLDADHRAAYDLRGLDAGTWRTGLDRLLVGVTMTEDEQRRFADRVLPLDDVDSSVIDLAGRVAELVDRVHAAVDAFAAAQPMTAWAAALATAADGLTATSRQDAWQRAELQRLLEDAVDEAGGRATPLSLPEVRALLGERLQGRPTRANFRTGHLTVCTLHPMRSVPHRVVALLGLDDTAFPRRAPRDGDDLLLADPRVGERDPRAEDRQMILDALMAAEDHLIVTYTGNDERTNAPRPPAVPVSELLDAIDRTAGDGARERVVARRPLQPFDPRDFRPPAPWSFDRVTLEGARALGAGRAEPAPFLTAPLPERRGPVVELEDLVRFVEHPVRAFLRQRLDVRLGRPEDEVADDLPVELDGLGKWGVGTRLLAARLRGVDRRTACLAEIARGTLPPGYLGNPVVAEIHPLVDAIADEAERRVAGGAAAGSVDVRATLPDGRTLSGSVPGVAGDVLRTVIYSAVAPKHRLAAWVRLLALTVAHPGRPFTAVTVGRRARDAVLVATLPRIEATAALTYLTELVDLFDAGMREPLPLYCKTSAAHAAGGDPAAAWTSEWGADREDAEREHVLVLGGRAPFAAVAADPRFDACARRLWRGLLEHERLEER